ncbi:MAG TPA: hypothetical protein VHR86_00190, partial [Armatimonadota bacterium]|nr:hypothetical protein [Armatimonadota bacterium]
CMACVKNCPGHAIHPTKTVQVNLAGHTVEWGELDCEACDIAFRGGQIAEEGEAGDYTEPMFGHEITRGAHTPFYKKPRNLYNTGQAVCGGRGCLRACMISLESRGVLKNKFHEPFRRRKPWSVDWSEEEENPTAPNPTEDVD